MDAAREDMAVIEVTEEGAENRTKLRWKIRLLDGRSQKKKQYDLTLSPLHCESKQPVLSSQ